MVKFYAATLLFIPTHKPALRLFITCYGILQPILIFMSTQTQQTQTNKVPADAQVPSSQFEFDCPYQASGPTTLRCAKCNRPLMAKDARRTPTGYVCPYYIKARVATFYNASPEHYVIVA